MDEKYAIHVAAIWAQDSKILNNAVGDYKMTHRSDKDTCYEDARDIAIREIREVHGARVIEMLMFDLNSKTFDVVDIMGNIHSLIVRCEEMSNLNK